MKKIDYNINNQMRYSEKRNWVSFDSLNKALTANN